MPASEARMRATAKWEKKSYDKVLLRMPKGRLDVVRAAAQASGESVNGFINDAIAQKLQRLEQN